VILHMSGAVYLKDDIGQIYCQDNIIVNNIDSLAPWLKLQHPQLLVYAIEVS